MRPKPRFILVSVFFLIFLVLNAIPSRARQQTPDENAQANNAACTERHWGFPFTTYSHYGGGGFISPMEMLVTEATPVFSQWHILGLVMDIILVVGGASVIFLLKLPGLPGEGQENIAIVRESDGINEEDESDFQ